MEKRRLSLNRSGGAKNYNNPLKGGPYSAHPVHYNMIENIHLDLDAMDNEIDKALNSTSTKVRQVTHNFTVLQSIYFNTDTRKWVLAQADDKDTIGTHIVVEVIDKDYFVAGLSGIFEVRNTLDLGYWFTSDTVAGELIDTAPDINNPMIQVIDSNTIRVLDIGIVDNLDSIPASNIIVTNSVTPDYTAPKVGDTMQDITNKVAGLQDDVIWEEVFEHDITEFELSVDKGGKQLDERGVLILIDGVVSSALNNGGLRLNSIYSSTYWNSVINDITNSAIIYCNGAADNIFSGTIQCYKNNNNIIIHQFIGNSNSGTGSPRTSFYTASLPASQNITNIKLFALRWRAGSKIKIYRL